MAALLWNNTQLHNLKVNAYQGVSLCPVAQSWYFSIDLPDRQVWTFKCQIHISCPRPLNSSSVTCRNWSVKFSAYCARVRTCGYRWSGKNLPGTCRQSGLPPEVTTSWGKLAEAGLDARNDWNRLMADLRPITSYTSSNVDFWFDTGLQFLFHTNSNMPSLSSFLLLHVSTDATPADPLRIIVLCAQTFLRIVYIQHAMYWAMMPASKPTIFYGM